MLPVSVSVPVEVFSCEYDWNGFVPFDDLPRSYNPPEHYIATANNKIFVAGKNADNIGNQSGGWTISWQGASGATTTGTTILQGIVHLVVFAAFLLFAVVP